jgi:hypothetical protein
VATKVLFGLQDLSNGSAPQAARQFRLAYQKSRDAGVDTTTLRLLLAASFAAAGDLPVATGWMETGPFPPMEFSLLPENARQALRDSGLADGPRPRLERAPAASESR